MKYFSMLLGALLLVGVGFYVYERHSHAKTRKEMNNQIAKLEGMVKETENAYSARAVELENLKSSNKELQKIIKNRNERILALNKVVLRWKDKYFEIKDAKETVIGDVPENCQSCLRSLRLRVDFDKTVEYMRIFGHTVTNPAEAYVYLEWLRGVTLNLILAKTKDGNFRVYMDSDNSDLVPAELNLTVDPSVFEKKWYEKFGIGLDIGAGEGVYSSFRLFYDILPDMYIGPNVSFSYDGNKLRKMYGGSLGWYPFR